MISPMDSALAYGTLGPCLNPLHRLGQPENEPALR